MVQVGSVAHVLQGGEAREEDIQFGPLAQACSRDKEWKDSMGMYRDESGTGTYCKTDQSHIVHAVLSLEVHSGGEWVSLA